MKPLLVEERLARVSALMLALRCTAADAQEMPGGTDACEWLYLMARDDLDKIKECLGDDVMNRAAP
ncbi:hypothetical protein [Reyranella sp.]|jgi:hypothetical protein|uniref:hypothetical protein n=1 Tax=Reyranella sp. TaxID=1929291 RepID=UPI000BD472F2|nr:hypothetical protein [Reyranella sp.]OYY46073.1 MAG: hypothetical protein B7Y57_04255 [Rhodospirillales bacterium 35-66-84]OYZ96453.1 MAG: hypothetical protein B7Y08_04615 [Rhodospirillales bacterium 24-66-33]OZB28384.1 MAG: hypothetical protein B7X63_00530 [Rhodospirillales bacterium 39-66-50]HQS14410.1 hypothetical protein [Reyranella sp.]HQT11407.1 hypothetical protein [Reyranella sp.]